MTTLTPAQAAAERVEAFLTARERWVRGGLVDAERVATSPRTVDGPGHTLTASDLRALVVAAWGGAGIKAALRWPECHEEVSRGGELQPCEKTAVALRIDPTEGGPYPVCAYHARAEMVPLSDVVQVGAADVNEGIQVIATTGVPPGVEPPSAALIPPVTP